MYDVTVSWYAPVVGYLMLASAWAPRGPFLWAVLPPVALWVLERVVVGSEYVGDYLRTATELADWHRPRIEVLLAAAPDLLAIETIPSVIEVEA